MEILLDIPIDLEQVADLCFSGVEHRPPSKRGTKAWHVTNLLMSAHDVVKGNARYHEGGPATGIMSFGRIWESAVDCFLHAYADREGGFYAPDAELTENGIIASLDGLMRLPKLGWIVCEAKLRFSLSREIPLSHLQQVRAYCHLADTGLVCYVSGHISSTPPTAQASLKIIKFTKQSIEECWQGILNTKEYLIGQGCCPDRGNNGDKS